jgi:hypothetical protein
MASRIRLWHLMAAVAGVTIVCAGLTAFGGWMIGGHLHDFGIAIGGTKYSHTSPVFWIVSGLSVGLIVAVVAAAIWLMQMALRRVQVAIERSD